VELTKAESGIDILQQRILHLHTEICSLKNENEAFSRKLPFAPNTTNSPRVWPREGTVDSEEEVIVAMSQVQIKEIQISEFNLEIEKLKKDAEDMRNMVELEEEVKGLR